MRRLALILVAVIAVAVSSVDAVLAAPGPEFRLGFASLAGQIPDVVGQPLEAEHYGPNGDSLQATSTGLMAWRKADNWTAFTDGATTWINGPAGVVSRPNAQRFPWEGEPQSVTAPAPVMQPAPPAPTPTPAARYFSPDVKAMDPESGGPGVMVKAFMQQLDADWARVWGWRPMAPVTVYLYSDGYRMADGIAWIRGAQLQPGERESIATRTAARMLYDSNTRGLAVAMSLDYGQGTSGWEATTKSTLAHEYTHVMQTLTAGTAGPTWFSEGMAELCSYSAVPGTRDEANLLGWVSRYKREGRLITLRELQNNWSGASSEVAYGVAYLAVRKLSEKVGGAPLLEVLRRTARGEAFEVALQAVTGYSLERLDAEYRSTIP